jgi:hypothetical protein
LAGSGLGGWNVGTPPVRPSAAALLDDHFEQPSHTLPIDLIIKDVKATKISGFLLMARLPKQSLPFSTMVHL